MKRLLFPIFVLALSGALLLFSQTGADTTALGRQADEWREQEDYPKAAAVLESLLEYHRRSGNWAAFSRRTKDLADALVEQLAFGKCDTVLTQAIGTLSAAGWADSLPVAALWTWKAYVFKQTDRFSEAQEAYDHALRLYEINRHNNPVVAYSYKNAAQICIRRFNYQAANKYLLAAIPSDTTGFLLISIYSQLAGNAYWQDSLDLALAYFRKGEQLPGDGDYQSASLQSNGALILTKMGALAKARRLALRALSYYGAQSDEQENQIGCLTNLADICRLEKKYEESDAYFRQAEAVGLGYFGGKHREMAKLYVAWGNLYLERKQEEQALHLYQKSIIQAYPAFNNPDPNANPEIKGTPLELMALEAPALKAALLLCHPSAPNRMNAAHCYDLAFTAAQLLRRTYSTDDAKLYLAQHTLDRYRQAALNLWQIYRETGQAGTLERLFSLLESNRANTLRDALQQQRALALAGVPDSLLKQEEALRLNIADGRTEYPRTDTSAPSLELFRLERRYSELLQQLNASYPQFFEFNNAGQTAGLAAVRAALPEASALLSWINAGDRFLCLTLRKSGLSAFEVPRDSALDAALRRFQLLLADKSGQERGPAAYFDDAWFLKQRLLPGELLTGIGHLIIVPDGPLAYLPFEALLTAPHRGAYSAAPYLLRTCAVQYAWSASLLTAEPPRARSGKGLLQVAPFVQSARDGLAVLPNSLRENPGFAASRLLEGPQALADTFLNEADRFAVLHLSTHAHAGQQSQPGIEFFDRTVWLPEIYAQRLNASLVSLSACETGAGAFAEGEGVLSLARAFAYAGAQSLVASHWSVNERSTADLFEAFYQSLKKGLPKSEALRQAKLQLLAKNGADARKAPFYWAAFTLSGADGPLDQGHNRWPWWAWALLAGGAGAVVWRLRKRYPKFALTKKTI